MDSPLPYVFIGSSSESKDIAREIESQLQGKARVKLWVNDAFHLGDYNLEALLNIIPQFDFGVFVFAPDDNLVQRGVQYSATRDNVIFEAGLFMGRLGRTRTFIIKDSTAEQKLPTDLEGVTIAPYKRQGDLSDDISPVCTRLIKDIDILGLIERKELIGDAVQQQDLAALSKKILQEYIDGVRMESWKVIYERACNLVNDAERRVRSTSFGLGKWRGDDVYVESIARTAKRQKDRNIDFVHKVVFGSTSENKQKRKQNIRKRIEYFENHDVLECLQVRELDESWGIDILIVDDKHLHLSFQRSSGNALVLGIELRDHPELGGPLTEWFDEYLFSKARPPEI